MRLFLLLCFIVFPFLSWNQRANALKTVNQLSSPEFKGRGYVGKGDSVAADFLSEQFRLLGAQTLPGQTSYFQPFTLNVNTIPETCVVKLNGKTLELAVDYLPQAQGGSINQSFDHFFRLTPGNIESHLKKTIDSSYANHLILLDLAGCSNRDTIGIFHQIARELAEIRPVVWVQHNKFTHTVSTRALPHPIVEIKAELLEEIASIEMIIQTEFITDYLTQNVIGMIPGRKKSKYICITAHYDHLGKIGPSVYFPGANDNASGVSMLLELMRHYQTHKPKYTLVFMGFAAEEAGILGSKHYLEHPLFPLHQIRFLVNCDLAGTGDEGITVVNGTLHKKQFKKLTKINRKKGYLTKVKIRGRAANSDHFWFSQKGVPAFFIYTLGGSQAYHDIYDKDIPLTEFNDYASLLKDFIRKL